MRIVVVSASLSESSSSSALGRRLVEAVEACAAASAAPVTTDWIELRKLAHPLVNSLLQGFPAPEVAAAQNAVDAAEAIIAVTPIYQASYSGLFKMFFDVLPEGSLTGKPVLLAATGGTGRHSLAIDHALRPLFAYLGAVAAPTGIFAATQDWGDPGLEIELGDEEALEVRIGRAAQELCRLAGGRPGSGLAGKEPAEAASEPEESYPGFVDFEDLLNAAGSRPIPQATAEPAATGRSESLDSP